MAKQMNERPPGTFPSDTQPPGHGNASSITTRSGKVLFMADKSDEEEKVDKKNDEIVVELKKKKE